jgi:hypothetical protein
MAKALAHFTINRAGEDYLLSFEDDEGETHEFTASFEILDLITESIEEQLENDEEDMLEVDDDDDEDDDREDDE